MRKKNNKCSINGCNNKTELTYYTYPICYKHWAMYCNGTYNLKKALKLTTELKNPTTSDLPIQKRLQ